MSEIKVTLDLEQFDQLRDGLDIAIELLEKIDEGEFDIPLELSREIHSFIERFK